ncbi:MAG: hypothetical protein LBV15_00205 [Planctomycetota bacterium]|jgi:hypothetical protein|nr:hypothetical protein [Planctomycetota bacterium]
MVETRADPKIAQIVKRHQRIERTAALVYRHLAKRSRDPVSRDILLLLSSQETEHAEIWRYYCDRKLGPYLLRYWFLILLGYLLGRRRLIALMVRDEAVTSAEYKLLSTDFPELEGVYQQEENHERELRLMLDSNR